MILLTDSTTSEQKFFLKQLSKLAAILLWIYWTLRYTMAQLMAMLAVQKMGEYESINRSPRQLLLHRMGFRNSVFSYSLTGRAGEMRCLPSDIWIFWKPDLCYSLLFVLKIIDLCTLIFHFSTLVCRPNSKKSKIPLFVRFLDGLSDYLRKIWQTFSSSTCLIAHFSWLCRNHFAPERSTIKFFVNNDSTNPIFSSCRKCHFFYILSIFNTAFNSSVAQTECECRCFIAFDICLLSYLSP